MDFVHELARLEEQIGTCQATLVGLMLATGHSEPHELEAGLDSMNHVLEMIPISLRTITDFDMLYDYLSPRLTFDENQHDPFLGLKALESSFANGTKTPIGNCIVDAELYALVLLGKGVPAGAAYKADRMHIRTFYPMPFYGLYSYDRVESNPQHYILKPVKKDVLENSFAFISHTLLYQVDRELNGAGKKVIQDFEELKRKLDIAELINPFNVNIYVLREKLASLQNDRSEEYKNAAQHYAMTAWLDALPDIPQPHFAEI
jgi:hypothetical protein